MKTTFVKCGKADMIILQCKGKTMIIDTGEDDDGEKLTKFLNSHGIAEVDYLVITHFDKDHVGGAAHLLRTTQVNAIYVPDYEGESDEYLAFIDTGARMNRLTNPVQFMLGSAEVEIDPPSSYQMPDDGGEYDNDFSLITIVQHGENRLLFMGDAENERIRDFMAKELLSDCDLIKLPHHGKYHSALRDLIDELKPGYAVITDSDKNPAEKKTLDLLADRNVLVFRTADGNVTAESDGAALRVEASF